MRRIVRIYISAKVSATVCRAQMKVWADVLDTVGIATDFVIVKNKVGTDLSEMIKVLPQSTVLFYGRIPLVRDLLLYWKMKRVIKKYEKSAEVVVQSRLTTISLTLFLLKFFGRTRIIIDFRGMGEEDPSVSGFVAFYRQLMSKINTQFAALISSVNLFVSEAHREKFQEIFRIHSHYSVIPGVADSNDFFFDAPIREWTRRQLGIEEQTTVLVYSGKLDKPWQIPEEIFKVFKTIRSKGISKFKFHLLILSPDIEIAVSLQKRYSISDSECTILKSEYQDLKKYYNAADYGLLLREVNLINYVASPTKFAEYLLTGLPVIITEKLGDYSSIVDSSPKFGFVVKWMDQSIMIDNNLIESIEVPFGTDIKSRAETAKFARNQFSKQAYTNVYRDIIYGTVTK